MASPTQHSLKALRDDGWRPVIVEHYSHHTRRTYDLYGFADILAVKDGERPRLIQTTDGSHMAARRTKILEAEWAPFTLKGGFRIFLHGWRKLKVKRGGKAMRWALKEEEITLADFHEQSRSRPRAEATA